MSPSRKYNFTITEEYDTLSNSNWILKAFTTHLLRALQAWFLRPLLLKRNLLSFNMHFPGWETNFQITSKKACVFNSLGLGQSSFQSISCNRIGKPWEAEEAQSNWVSFPFLYGKQLVETLLQLCQSICKAGPNCVKIGKAFATISPLVGSH